MSTGTLLPSRMVMLSFTIGLKRAGQVKHLFSRWTGPLCSRLAGYGDDGGEAQHGIGHSRYEIGGTGTKGGQAYLHLASHPRLHSGHERRRLLVPRQYELDFGGGQAIHELDVLLARDAEDLGHPICFQALYDEFRGLHLATHSNTRARSSKINLTAALTPSSTAHAETKVAMPSSRQELLRWVPKALRHDDIVALQGQGHVLKLTSVGFAEHGHIWHVVHSYAALGS